MALPNFARTAKNTTTAKMNIVHLNVKTAMKELDFNEWWLIRRSLIYRKAMNREILPYLSTDAVQKIYLAENTQIRHILKKI